MINQRTLMSQTPAQSGVVAARATGRVRLAPTGVWVAFCTAVLATTGADPITTPHRRPPIE